MQIALNSSLVTCFKCCGLGSDGPVTCLQAHQGCLLAGNAEGQLVRFAQQPNSSIWVEDKRVCVTSRVTSLDAAEDASQAVVGTSMGTIWYGQVSHASCLLFPTPVCEFAALIWHLPSVLSLTASSAMSARSTLCPAQHKTPTHKMGSCVVVDIDLIWLTLLRTLEDNHTGTQDRVVLRQSCKHEHIMVKVLRCGEYCFLQKEPSLSASKALNRSCHILLIAYFKA